jgi:Family of unknown function (DUF5678)
MIVHEIQANAQPIVPPQDDKWRREQRAFFRLLGGLLESHRGQYVAVHNGEVVASGPDLVGVTLKAYALHGRQPIYVDLVQEHPHPAIHYPHYREPASR